MAITFFSFLYSFIVGFSPIEAILMPSSSSNVVKVLEEAPVIGHFDSVAAAVALNYY
jgi:hypothetical protein